jgi:hypothetical protein
LRILTFFISESQISDQDPTTAKKRGGGIVVVLTFLEATNFTRLTGYDNKNLHIHKELKIFLFLLQKLLLSSQKYGLGMRDPRSSEKKLVPNSDPRVKKAQDRGSGFATLILRQGSISVLWIRIRDPDPYWIRIQSDHWIRIRIRNLNTDPDPDLGGQK